MDYKKGAVRTLRVLIIFATSYFLVIGSQYFFGRMGLAVLIALIILITIFFFNSLE